LKRLKRNDHSKNQSVHRRIILKNIVEKTGLEGVDQIDLARERWDVSNAVMKLPVP
jgi:hypothetical protein